MSKTSEESFKKLFLPFGPITKIKLTEKGFGFVTYDTDAAANSAVNCMNNFLLNGTKLQVSIKKSK